MGQKEVNDEPGRMYPKLSPEQKDAFLKDFKQAVLAGSVKLPKAQVIPISPRPRK